MLTSVQFLLAFSLTTLRAFSANSGDEGTAWYGLPNNDILTRGLEEEVEGTEKHPQTSSSCLPNSPILCGTLGYYFARISGRHGFTCASEAADTQKLPEKVRPCGGISVSQVSDRPQKTVLVRHLSPLHFVGDNQTSNLMVR
ncbi:hypothetical protein BDN71DRAFT_367748 [Pleurotus eryngii]|uniref:Secreted protein n=1 Tax=Pleurotus eryngii TaxID=5323 RepID=A0A9P5ZKG9_PLEER|nr:hypothetical protein BDN71DRAFT_367748 [Pleurotus eryngii]